MRQTIIETLGALAKNDFVRAAWLAGSDATGRTDGRSDIDLMVIVADGRVEDAFVAVRGMLAIGLEYRLPAPTWHGADQAFFHIEGAPDWLMIDLVVLEKSKPHAWLEIERHGRAQILFDKDGLVREEHVDRAAIDRTIRENVERLRKRFQLFHHLPPKLVGRGLAIDAVHFYHALVLRPLVDMLRAVHCPDRHDFGFRYVKDDLPKEQYDILEELSYPRPGDIVPFTERAKILFEHYSAILSQ